MAALEFYNGAYGLAEAKSILFCTFCSNAIKSKKITLTSLSVLSNVMGGNFYKNKT